MGTKIKRPAIDLLSIVLVLLKYVEDNPKVEEYTFDFDDFTGAASDNVRTLDFGWKPKRVYLGTARQREGDGNAVKFAFDGFVWSITFATAPLSTDYALIDAERTNG